MAREKPEEGFGESQDERAECLETSVLEMHHNPSANLVIVLRLLEKTGSNVVGLQAARKTRIEVVIGAASRLDTVRAPAVPRGLRLFVSSAEDGMDPGFPSIPPRGDLWPCPVDQQFHVFAVKNLRCKRGRDVSFDAEPFVREIRHGRSYAHGAGVEDGRPKPDPIEAKPKFPAGAVGTGVKELRLR